MGLWDHVPSLSTALQTASDEYNNLSVMVDAVPTKQPGQSETAPSDDKGAVPVKPKSQEPKDDIVTETDENDHGMLDSLKSGVTSALSNGMDLMSAVGDLTSVDVNVKAGGKVEAAVTTNSTVTFAVDRNSILYSALASFLAMEAFRYFNR